MAVDFIGGVMVSVLPSSAVDCGFESWMDQDKDYKFGICCLSAIHINVCYFSAKQVGVRAKTGGSESG